MAVSGDTYLQSQLLKLEDGKFKTSLGYKLSFYQPFYLVRSYLEMKSLFAFKARDIAGWQICTAFARPWAHIPVLEKNKNKKGKPTTRNSEGEGR